MKKFKYKLSLFIFRRDLRLTDNTALIAALKNSEKVIPCFILDPRQIKSNPYKSWPCIQFMFESLLDLQQQLQSKQGKLYLFYGIPEKIIATLLKKQKINAVYFNRDYTPFSNKRDHAIARICLKYELPFHIFDDSLINPPRQTLKSDGHPYQIFSRFYANAKLITVSKPSKNPFRNYFNKQISESENWDILNKILPHPQFNMAAKGGRKNCQKKLSRLYKLENYATERDFPAQQCTTGLSPYIKFNTYSIREIYYAVKKNLNRSEALLRELHWRDFFTVIAFYFPHVFGHPFQKKYENLAWKNNRELFKAWCTGKTGFPIVDAGMRELNSTGIMHNRVRLITASFLIKDLHIDWRWGEKYFAKKLLDYDPAINNGNWQWVASTGADAQPYFRIFNPWLQQKKFDYDCRYIKKWIPELKNIDPKIIHRWADKHITVITTYPAPIINHSRACNKAKKMFMQSKA